MSAVCHDWKNSQCDLDIIKLLLENGADVNRVDFIGFTALHHACRKGASSVVSLLINEN